jgi:hypothetical protein
MRVTGHYYAFTHELLRLAKLDSILSTGGLIRQNEPILLTRYNRTAAYFLPPVAEMVSFATVFRASKNKGLEVAKVSCKKTA